MRVKIKVLDEAGTEKKELVVEVPKDITIGDLIQTLKLKRHDLFDREEYQAFIEVPTDKLTSGPLLDDGSIIIIRPKSWDLAVRIIE